MDRPRWVSWNFMGWLAIFLITVATPGFSFARKTPKRRSIKPQVIVLKVGEKKTERLREDSYFTELALTLEGIEVVTETPPPSFARLQLKQQIEAIQAIVSRGEWWRSRGLLRVVTKCSISTWW